MNTVKDLVQTGIIYLCGKKMTNDMITAIGLGAAFCTTISFLPQAIRTIKTKDTSGISLYMYFLFTFGTFLWLAYGLLTHNLPVTVANAVLTPNPKRGEK